MSGPLPASTDRVLRRRTLLIGAGLGIGLGMSTGGCAADAGAADAGATAGPPVDRIAGRAGRPSAGSSSTAPPTVTAAPRSSPSTAGASGSPSGSPSPRTRPRVITAAGRVDPRAVAARYAGQRPRAWGDRLPGIVSALPVGHVTVRGRRRPVAALTFDACGNPRHGSSGYDEALIETLRRYRVPATLFLSGRWIAANPSQARDLAADPLFEIGNHGTAHVPLSVTGRSAYGIRGTRSAAAAVDEVWGNTLTIERLLGRRPALFRTGTACYDDVGVSIVHALGQTPVGYTLLGDFGATAPAGVVARQLRSLPPGGIALSHMNHPEKDTAEGLALALPRMLRAGWAFVRVGDVL